VDRARQARWCRWLRTAPEHTGAGLFELLAEYGLPVTRVITADSTDAAVSAAEAIGYPVVLKTAEPGIAHKTEAGGVALGISGPAGLRAAYAGLAARLGPRVLVCETVGPGVELAVGITHDPALGPLVVVAAGGVLTEYFADRAVALPPVDTAGAERMISRLRVAPLLAGARGQPAAGTWAIAGAITSVATIACELGDELAALDINPLICGPQRAVAVDALAFTRSQ
jgi:succinyl-CoA synthetase beta subunit